MPDPVLAGGGDLLPLSLQIPDEEVAAARLVVAGLCGGTEDCRLLLEILGIGKGAGR